MFITHPSLFRSIVVLCLYKLNINSGFNQFLSNMMKCRLQKVNKHVNNFCVAFSASLFSKSSISTFLVFITYFYVTVLCHCFYVTVLNITVFYVIVFFISVFYAKVLYCHCLLCACCLISLFLMSQFCMSKL